MTAPGNKPLLPGGNYRATDTRDGFVTLHDVPIMGHVAKGTKGAPEDIGHDWLDGARKFGDDSFIKNKICYPIHVGHHDEMGARPEFAGFFRPTRTGTIEIDGQKEEALFSDLKVKKSIYSRIESGELPYVSPEIRNWSKRRISSVALLASEPPHFQFPIVTPGQVTEDSSASFSADLPEDMKIATFEDGKERVMFGRVTFDPVEDEKNEKEIETKKLEGKPMADEKKQDEQLGKPNPSPVELPHGAKPVSQIQQVVAKMEDDPKAMARFAAMEDRNAALEKRLNERDSADRAKALEAKAIEALKGWQIGDKARQQIAKFAAEGEDRLNAFVETLKEVSAKDSPRTFAAAEAAMSVPVNDPALAKFAQAGPEKLESAARFASEYRTLKAHGAGKGMTITEEAYVRFQMEQEENPGQDSWGVNLGVAK